MSANFQNRLHPRLRVMSNRSDPVNANAAVFSTRIASSYEPPAKSLTAAAEHALGSGEQFAQGELPGGDLRAAAAAAPRRPKITAKNRAHEAFVNVFIETFTGDADGPSPVDAVVKSVRAIVKEAKLPRRIARSVMPRRNFVSATVPVDSLPALSALPNVAFVHAAESLSFSLPSASADSPAKPTPRDVKSGGKRLQGENVLIGIIDVGGFDFAHPDFLDDKGNTRFESIWDQGGRFRAPPKPFGYGSEIDSARLRAAMAAQKAGGLPAVDLERQSQRSVSSHGTHVASIAAGRSGVCPGARIAGVLVAIPVAADARAERRLNFSDSSRIVDAIEYLYALGKKLDLPVSINISLGTNGGAHDGSNGPCRWIDSSLSTPGRAICVAAGNAGQEAGTTPDDLGWIMGRIHTAGKIPSAGLAVDLEWQVVGDGIADVSENELEIWYGAQDRITVSVLPPGGTKWLTVAPRQYIENQRLSSGTVVSVYSELYHPTNGDNYIAIYLSPTLDSANFAPIAPGIWKVRLHGDEIRSGHFNAWIERDDPMEIDRAANLRAFRFPSFFTKTTNIDSHSIGSLACAHRVLAVANVDSAIGRVNVSSSQGPTRDGRSKPDIAAPGTNIAAANGFGADKWVGMTGTSMASPYVCGVIGLMLSAKRTLNAAQCQGILKRTARPLPSHGYEWRNDAGFGLIDPVAAIEEAKVFDVRSERSRSTP